MVTKRTYPAGSRFHPTDLGLVRLHLKYKVKKNISGFIKTMNVYGDSPWRLDHDTNPLYPRNEWFYFVPRTIRGTKTVSRIVPRNGDSEGGTWKSIGKKQEIKNKQKKVKGYKTELVFNKNVVHGNTDKDKTVWHMAEYSLNLKGEEFHDLVLCHIRLLHSAERFKPLVPAHHLVDNNVFLPNQEQQEAVDLANHNGMIMVDINQQQQQQQQEEKDSLIPLQEIKDNQEQYCPFAYHGAEDDMTSGYDGLMQFFKQGNDVNQQQHEQQQDSPAPLLPPLQSNNHGQYPSLDNVLVPSQVDNNNVVENNDNNNVVLPNQEQQQVSFANQNDMRMMLENDRGDVNQQQQLEQEDSMRPPLQRKINDLEKFLMEDNDGEDGCETFQLDDGFKKLLDEYDHIHRQKQLQQEQQDSPAPLLPPIQSNNHGQCPSLDNVLVPSQVDNNKVVENNDNNNVFLPSQEQHEQQQDSPVLPLAPLQSNDANHPCEDYPFDGDYLTSDIDDIFGNLPPLESSNNHGQYQYPSWDMVQLENHNDNVFLPNKEQQEAVGFDNQEQEEEEEGQKDSRALDLPPLEQINDNQEQEHCPWEDYDFDGADDNLTVDVDDILKVLNEGKDQEDSSTLLLPPLQSSNNHGQCPSQSQVDNHNNNNTVVPNQEHGEASIANQNDMSKMVAKEHGGDVKQEKEDLQNILHAPSQSNDNKEEH